MYRYDWTSSQHDTFIDQLLTTLFLVKEYNNIMAVDDMAIDDIEYIWEIWAM